MSMTAPLRNIGSAFDHGKQSPSGRAPWSLASASNPCTGRNERPMGILTPRYPYGGALFPMGGGPSLSPKVENRPTPRILATGECDPGVTRIPLKKRCKSFAGSLSIGLCETNPFVPRRLTLAGCCAPNKVCWPQRVLCGRSGVFIWISATSLNTFARKWPCGGYFSQSYTGDFPVRFLSANCCPLPRRTVGRSGSALTPHFRSAPPPITHPYGISLPLYLFSRLSRPTRWPS